MKLQWGRRGDNLYIYLSGELDEHSVAGVRGEADKLIDENAGLSRAVFNLAGLKFMDSSSGAISGSKNTVWECTLRARKITRIRSSRSADCIR